MDLLTLQEFNLPERVFLDDLKGRDVPWVEERIEEEFGISFSAVRT